jgi:hypothetical protein
LNKQYSKEEYDSLVPKIIEHMKKTGEWGEFFPIRLSPFEYNKSVAMEYYPLQKEEVLSKGWKWKDHDQQEYKKQTYDVANDIKDIPDSITKEILACSDCRKNYRIIAQELTFYRRMGVAIPSKCPDCRHKARMALRNDCKLWKNKCSKCGVDIKTSYSPNRPEKVYCEKCYLEEVY